jgi:hypothetical protein
VLGQIEQAIRSALMFAPPEQVENTIEWFRQAFSVPVTSVDLNKINEMISLLGVEELRGLFTPGRLDMEQAKRNFDIVWETRI